MPAPARASGTDVTYSARTPTPARSPYGAAVSGPTADYLQAFEIGLSLINTVDFVIELSVQYNSQMIMSDLAVTPDPLDQPAVDGPDAQARKFQRELSAGLTSLVLLSVLADATEDLYGYEIARRLTGDGERASPFKQGALYPVLRNMSAAGLLSSRVVPSYSGPPRRYYRITPLGHEVWSPGAQPGRKPAPSSTPSSNRTQPRRSRHDGRDTAHGRAVPRLASFGPRGGGPGAGPGRAL